YRDRLAYFPCSGLELVIAAAILSNGRSPAMPSRTRAALFFAVALSFAVRSVVRNPVWKDDETLFTETVRTSPESAKAHYNLAWVSAEKGRVSVALGEYAL